MNKCSAFARQGRPLGISAAVAAQSKGKIYIESFSEPAVMEAIQGVRGLMQYSMRLVPIGDMTTVMTVVSKKKMGRFSPCIVRRLSQANHCFFGLLSQEERLGSNVPWALQG